MKEIAKLPEKTELEIQRTQESKRWEEYLEERQKNQGLVSLYHSQVDCYSIYQLKDIPETSKFRFMMLDYLKMKGIEVDIRNYNLVYSAPLDRGMALKDIYKKFKIPCPPDFTGHEISTSDIITLHQNGESTSYYINPYKEFIEVPGFEVK